jgi:hypothetical protein
MRLQELVELRLRAEAEPPPQLGLGQMTKPEFFQSQRFGRAPLDLARPAEKPGEFVGDIQGDFHASNTWYYPVPLRRG